MSRSQGSKSGSDQKVVSRQTKPRPGTMAHLRHVEEQKRKEIEEHNSNEALTLGRADLSPVEETNVIADKAILAQTEFVDETNLKAHMVIHGAAVAAAAAGGGLAQIPGSASLVIAPIQMSMIIALGSLQGKALDKSGCLAVLSAACGPYVGRTLSQVFIGLIPGLGNAVNAATAFVVTESIGWAAFNVLSKD